MSVLSIQSSVSYGHVGNSAAAFALQRLGIETLPVSTVTLAHHPGHGAWRGRIAEPRELAALIDGLEAMGALAECDAVLSGYLGDVSLGAALLDAVWRVKAANPQALYCCDPVMGEHAKGFYVSAGIPEFFRDQAQPCADILLPNLFELGWLAKGEGARAEWNIETAHAAARLLIARGPRLVVVKGLRRVVRGRQRIGALAVTAKTAWHAEAPLVEAPAYGAGDLFAALFLAHTLRGRNPARALELAVSVVHGVMARTAALGAHELALIPAQSQLAQPKRLFKAARIG